MQKIEFTKMHGLGNDFVIIDRRSKKIEINNNLMNERPGVMKLTKKWAERRIEDLSSKYLSTGPSYFVGVYDANKLVGFVTYTIEGNNEYGNMPSSLNIWDIMYLNNKAAINIWNYCLNIDLVDEINAKGVPEDDVLESLLISPGSLNARITTSFWIRIVDVIKALEARSYNEKGKLIFKLSDSIINQNNNTFLLDNIDGNLFWSKGESARWMNIAMIELSLIHIPSPRDGLLSRMPSSA